MPRYNPAEIEPKWQAYWEREKTFECPRLPQGPKMYVLDMFPYPSGEGLHVGHPEGYTATDIVCRYKRMRGYTVLHPMGFDAFGLPAEQHAKKTGTPPRITTERNIANFRRQLKMLGFSYDWSRELSTTDVDYFRWTQWIFLLLYDTWYDVEVQRGRPISELPIPDEIGRQGESAARAYQDEHRLAYEAHAPVNWCPALGTVLANEEVIDGKSERGQHPVVRLPLRQWMLRITAYADRLESDLEGLDWSEGIKKRQRDWIGRSVGAEVDFFIGTGDPLTAAGQIPSAFAAEQQTWKQARKLSGFPRKPGNDALRVYTTRPDTLFGATYMVIAPEHALADRLTTPDQLAAVSKYREEASRKSDLDRTELAKDKTGVFTGSYAVNPVNNTPIPIWMADYVLASYGTGAIMAVPAHDKRDFEFAEKFGISIVAVVDPGEAISPESREQVLTGKAVFPDEGIAVQSGVYNGMPTAEMKSKISSDLQAHGVGRAAVNYKLRDWLFSRQHFWGEPFPLLHELNDAGEPTGQIVPLRPEDLPVDLPELAKFDSHGSPEPPLDQAPESWLYPEINGRRYKRETNTMPQWAGSCWYYLRFIDPKNKNAFVDPALERAWMPVDLYIGGAEHAVLHLLYSRFWHKVLFDRGYVSVIEPFYKLVNQGMILGEVEFTGFQLKGQYVSATDVVAKEDAFLHKPTGEAVESVNLSADECVKQGESFVLAANPSVRVVSRAFKMSKSRGNVVNPDAVVREFGADSLRLYEMFMGPLEATKPWSMDGVSGVRNFLDRFWRLIVNDKAEVIEPSPALCEEPATTEQLRVVHRTIAGVTEDLEKHSFNTAIAKLMEFTNFFMKEAKRPRWAIERGVLLLSPLAPHLAEELWSQLGHAHSLAYEPWPTADEAYLKDDVVELPVQVNGKLRGVIQVPHDVTLEQAEAAALAFPNVAEYLAGKTIVKKIVVPGKMVNFVVK